MLVIIICEYYATVVILQLTGEHILNSLLKTKKALTDFKLIFTDRDILTVSVMQSP